ncbi:similar to Saccharomyces cerevisiae YDR528W HLR1 Protein involved in regulation of cell wall composition and integrity and response to osmotic stress [Maudiozyma saulgeensis]|uniref:Similar to Saccharomyces cerevisiae YDR528W HLR1 Protein involved in regulation of cell wall composition and integrity and response to osmotic stress n=1 Tax=Maudiozyma saulgeensis TaxID=1789683 RepID=A0A1X7R330_9SACH|nr:similar to Saccharomyces cerevisiae YDR528W HLR1 Protein involved in regulation of cell wall composition and integrity and response to osmotic stress [Kazachstania saulgeensis]
MAETQPLQFSSVPTPSSNNLATPSRRGHSHRRSFAVSGDFEFLKQPPNALPGTNSSSVPPLPRCISPEPYTKNKNNLNVNNFNPHDYEKPNDVSFSNVLTPRKISNDISSPSPRFFISEEPRFTSPVKGVPDAIINLDDALKTKPRSFKSHRRSESAPADLEVAIDFKHARSIPDFRIDEEEDATDLLENANNDSDDSNNNNINNGRKSEMEARPNRITEPTPFGLMSPLRPSSPAFKKNYEMNETSSSPTKLIFHQQSSGVYSNGSKTDQYNSLKIKRQKQRYYHYTKQLPTNNITVNTQTQALQEKKSATSLISATSKTPVTMVTTPSNAINSPVTPLSSKEFNPTPTNCNIIINSDKSTGNNTNISSSGGSTSSISNLHEQRRARSPDFLVHQQIYQKYPSLNNHNSNNLGSKFIRRNSGPAIQSSFKFESKSYDIPLNDKYNDPYNEDTLDEYPINERSVTPKFGERSLMKQDYNRLQKTESHDTNNSLNATNGKMTLSMDILMGEPGDTVDLSNNGSTEIINGVQNISITSPKRSSSGIKSINDASLSNIDKVNKKISMKSAEDLKVVGETRSASDSVMEMKSNRLQNNSTTKIMNNSTNITMTGKKKRSKLSIFTNLFSK